MSPISWIFRKSRKVMAKVVNKSIDSSTVIGRRRELYKVFPVSEALARFVGQNEISFSTAIVIVLQYIGDHNLVNLEYTEEVFCDDKLKTIFNGEDTVVGLEEIKELLMRHFPIHKTIYGTAEVLEPLASFLDESKVCQYTNAGYRESVYETVEVLEPLASFLGKSKVCQFTAMIKVWAYVNAHNLWEKHTEMWIRCDEKLKTILDGKDKVVVDGVWPLLKRHFPDLNLNN